MPSQVFVKTLTGTLCVQTEGQVETIGDLKNVVAARTFVPAEDQRLIFAGKQWEDEELLAQEECTYHLTMSLDGGGKKRKKKTYTKPKKIKRKHKKVKLAVLKYYRVDQASGKVTRLRKECPHPDCGAGVFMGLHFNRHYCGKCGLTYMISQPGEGGEAPAAAAGGKGKKGKK